MELTREKVLEMVAGRDLDALILQRVFETHSGLKQGNGELIDEHGSVVPFYSTNIEAAWKVVKKLSIKYGVSVYEDDGAPSECHLYNWGTKPRFAVEAETAPLAICKAALLTTLTEQEDNQ